jgi:predicted phosphate transport protein (TIGR00153 family)
MFKRFMPKKRKFFEILNELSFNIVEAAKLLNEMLIKHEDLAEYSSKIHMIENKCDELTHKIISELNETFITPIDREDIHALTNSLDDIIDSINAIATRVSFYKIKKKIPFGDQLSDVLLQQVKILSDAVTGLQNYDGIFEKLVSIRNLETEGDSMFREAVSSLFENESDLKELIKQKEFLENIERAVDKCQTATIVIEGILIKNV